MPHYRAGAHVRRRLLAGADTQWLERLVRSTIAATGARICLIDAYGLPGPSGVDDARRALAGGRRDPSNVTVDPSDESRFRDFLAYAPYSASAQVVMTGPVDAVVAFDDAEFLYLALLPGEERALEPFLDVPGWD